MTIKKALLSALILSSSYTSYAETVHNGFTWGAEVASGID